MSDPQEKPDLDEEKELAEKAEASETNTTEENIIPEILSAEEESFKDRYLRTRADLENIQRRMREERSTLRINTTVNFVKELLPFIDNLDRALLACKDDDTELVKGLKLSRSQFDTILNTNNIKKINCEGFFDAKLHEAVTSIEDVSKPSNSIAAVLETGYVLNDRVIRYSKVQVTTGGPDAEESQEA